MISIGFLAIPALAAALVMAREGDIIDALFQFGFAVMVLYLASIPLLV